MTGRFLYSCFGGVTPSCNCAEGDRLCKTRDLTNKNAFKAAKLKIKPTRTYLHLIIIEITREFCSVIAKILKFLMSNVYLEIALTKHLVT